MGIDKDSGGKNEQSTEREREPGQDRTTESDTEKLQRSMRESITALKLNTPHKWALTFYNNLRLFLPGKEGKQDFAMYAQWKMLDEPTVFNAFSSIMRGGKTLREFFEDIEKAVQSCQTDIQRINELHESIIKNPYRENGAMTHGKIKTLEVNTRELEELYQLLKPLYLHLRSIGYSHYDLTGTELEEEKEDSP